VRGPASRVEGLDSVRLRPFDLATVGESGIYEVPVDTTGLAGSRPIPSVANLGIRVEDQVERILADVAVQVALSDGQADVVVDPAQVDIRLRGPRTLVTTVDPRDLTVMVVPELVGGMLVGEERRVPLHVEGVPELVQATLLIETVVVRRAAADRSQDREDGGSR